jgi:lysophospholipase L1-like esterase
MRKQAARLAASGFLLCVATDLRAATVNLGNIVALGDSITEGKYGLNDPPGLTGGYRQYLQNDLTNFPGTTYTYDFVGQEDSVLNPDGSLNTSASTYTGYSNGMADPNHEGYGSFTINDIITGYTLEGHTSPPIAQLLQNDANASNMPASDTNHNLPSVVLLLIGTNDALGPTAGTMVSSLNTLVGDIVAADPTVTLYVASILPVNPVPTPGGPNTSPQTQTNIENYNAQIPGIVSSYNTTSHPVKFVDLYSTINPYTQTSDGVHPTYQGYQQIAQAWAQAIDENNRGLQTIVNTSTFTSGVGTAWAYGDIFVNAFDPNGNLNGAVATFQTDSGSNFPNVFMSAEAGTILLQSTQHLASLTIGDGATVQVTPTTPGSRSIVSTWQYFIDNGTLDLTNNSLEVQSGSLSTISSLIQQGLNGSGGIISTTAASNTTHLTTLGVILNNVSGYALYGSGSPLGLFEGTSPANNDVLVSYTYYGDANLDGKVDGSDYSLIDNGYINHLTGWYNGDFNYDGVVDGSDYTLIDNAFNTQGAALDALLASPTATVTTELAASPSATSVPEPLSLTILSLISLTLLSSRRSHHRKSH